MRNLVKDDDDELKEAYDRFRKAVEREQNVVRNAILAGVEHLKINTTALQASVQSGRAVAEQINRNTATAARETKEIRDYILGIHL